ncbi:hypothetical protein PSE_p0311 (plasmid) [Pseudovibrio sp. FO-BEG1]|nr:hypothetical protein PSE_p0311 [Pseudovibrio sp. FO-BEG1]
MQSNAQINAGAHVLVRELHTGLLLCQVVASAEVMNWYI